MSLSRRELLAALVAGPVAVALGREALGERASRLDEQRAARELFNRELAAHRALLDEELRVLQAFLDELKTFKPITRRQLRRARIGERAEVARLAKKHLRVDRATHRARSGV